MWDYDPDSAPTTHSRRALLAAGGAAGTALLGGCLGGRTDAGAGTTGTTRSTADSGGIDWQSVELDAVRGDESFTIAGLSSPTIIQSFAVWCPKCERLLNQLAGVSDEYTVVGLNTDPNEDAAKVREHAEANGFGWRFAVAPTDLTDALIAEFGSTVVNAPSTPVIVVCGDGRVTFLSGGDSTRSAIADAAEGC